jgi:uncharacterized membrane protein YdjX (TVP38/TMEM64 family)
MHTGWLHYVVGCMHFIQGEGWLGWLIFIALYALCCLIFVPGSLLTVGAGAVYGFWGGVLLVLAGNGLGSLASLLITRYLLHGWAAKKVAQNPKLRALEDAVKHDGWKMVFLTRLSPVMPFSLINYALGLTNISALNFLLATELGAVPATCLYVYAGKLIGNLALIGPEIRQHRPLEWVIQGGGLIFTIAITIYATRVATKALHKRIQPRTAG